VYYQCKLKCGNLCMYGWVKKLKVGDEVDFNERAWVIEVLHSRIGRPRDLLGWTIN